MTQYYEYPSYIGGGLLHWINFDGFAFNRGLSTGEQTVDIALYIPPDALQTSYKSDYTTVDMGQIGGRALAAAQKAGGGANLTDVLAAQAKSLVSEAGLTAAMRKKAGEKGMTIMAQTSGNVLSPYLVAAYKGPTDMREHKFTFKFNPHNVDESMVVTKIINEFKKAMLPSSAGGDNKSSPSGMFGYPDEWIISYVINGEPLPENHFNPMFNIGRSVLKACDVDYATESVPLFFEGTQFPVSAQMSLTFMELEVMTREKITGSLGQTRGGKSDIVGGH